MVFDDYPKYNGFFFFGEIQSTMVGEETSLHFNPVFIQRGPKKPVLYTAKTIYNFGSKNYLLCIPQSNANTKHSSHVSLAMFGFWYKEGTHNNPGAYFVWL